MITGLVVITKGTANNDPGEYQVKAFHGNRIEVTYRQDNNLGVTKRITVDNQDPLVLVSSPSNDLVTKKSVARYLQCGHNRRRRWFRVQGRRCCGQQHVRRQDADRTSVKGRIQLYVGRYPVVLSSSDFTAIDDGWRVSKTLNSSDIAGLGDKVPWRFSVEDLAGNEKESAGNLEGKITDGSDGRWSRHSWQATLRTQDTRIDVFVGRSD